MEVKRYAINEDLAKTAHDMNSMSEYGAHTATDSYCGYLGNFFDEVNKLIQETPEERRTAEVMEAVEYYINRYSYKLAAAINEENKIEAMCPSIMISGGSNFPVRKKEKQNAARERFWQENGNIYRPTETYYFDKIRNLLTNKTIYSNDSFALEKLQNKLDDLQKGHEEMKAQNVYWRKNGTMKGYEGFTDEEAEKKNREINNSLYKVPFPSYELSYALADIKRVKQRIESITKLKENAEKPTADKYPKVDGVEVVENADEMRIQLKFDGKPDEATRELLKHNGFRWSPRFTAWQRQLNTNGIYATQSVLKELKGE